MENKSGIFIYCQGKLWDFRRPKIMGIVNVTPDSFYADSRADNNKNLLSKVAAMIREGADIIDIGGYSSRPGATDIPEEEEIRRAVPAIEKMRKEFPDMPVSVDTFRSRVAKEALDAGACMVNDISGGTLDENMIPLIGRKQVPYVLMHMRGTPQTMQDNPVYENIITDINRFFAVQLKKLKEHNVNDVILDPGFGFGKTLEHNYTILKNLDKFLWHNKPLLVGISRKSMLFKVLNGKPGDMLNATTVANTIALMKGAAVLRVHDVREARETVDIYMQMMLTNDD